MRTPRVLYVSSPIGLGHAQRDVAIARELRRLVPEVEIDWLAQDPVTRVLEGEGERIHPMSRHLASESGHRKETSHDHHRDRSLHDDRRLPARGITARGMHLRDAVSVLDRREPRPRHV